MIAFELKAKAVHHVHAPVIYRSRTRVKGLLQMSVAECAIQFWRKGLPASKILRFVEYMGVRDIVSAHSGFRNIVTSGPHFSVNELVYGDGLSRNDQNKMM